MMETMPMALDALDAPGAPGAAAALADFRIGAQREIVAMLRQLCDANAGMQLHAADGGNLDATIWTIDSDRRALGFNLDAEATDLQSMLDGRALTAVGYLESVKVQFSVDAPVLVRGVRSSVLQCALPRVLYRFQRRSAYRVRPPMRSTPVARLLPEQPGPPLALRVLDVSIGGCALFLPHGTPAPAPGSVFAGTRIELDAGTHFEVSLRLQHVTSLTAEARGVRLGFEFVRPDATTQRTLQRFIDLTQQRVRIERVD